MGEVSRFAWYSLRRLLTSPRLYLALFVIYVLLRASYGDVHLYVEETGEILQAAELMIFSSASRFPQWMLVLGLLLLLGDAPFFHAGMSVYLVRSSRTKWLLGQILFCVITSVGYLLAVEMMLLSLSGSGVSFANQWSDSIMVACRVTDGAALLHIDMATTFPINIVLSGNPYAMFSLTMLYDTLLFTLLALLCLALNARWKTGVGCLGVAGLLVLRNLIDYSGILTNLKIISPCNLASLGGEMSTPASIAYRVAFFLSACGLLGVWGHHIIRSADLQGGENP